MSQYDLYMLLKNIRLSGDHSFFTVDYIRSMCRSKGINEDYYCISRKLRKLKVYGFLECFYEKKSEVVRYRFKLESVDDSFI